MLCLAILRDFWLPALSNPFAILLKGLLLLLLLLFDTNIHLCRCFYNFVYYYYYYYFRINSLMPDELQNINKRVDEYVRLLFLLLLLLINTIVLIVIILTLFLFLLFCFIIFYGTIVIILLLLLLLLLIIVEELQLEARYLKNWVFIMSDRLLLLLLSSLSLFYKIIINFVVVGWCSRSWQSCSYLRKHPW